MAHRRIMLANHPGPPLPPFLTCGASSYHDGSLWRLCSALPLLFFSQTMEAVTMLRQR